MTTISVKDAAIQLDRLVQLAREGEEVILTESNAPAAKIVPVPAETARAPQKTRRAGSGIGIFIVSPDFDALLDDFAEYME